MKDDCLIVVKGFLLQDKSSVMEILKSGVHLDERQILYWLKVGLQAIVYFSYQKLSFISPTEYLLYNKFT